MLQAPLSPLDDQKRLNLNEPRWDQTTFVGRARHFFDVTDPRKVFASSAQLDAAKKLVEDYRSGIEPSGTTDEEVWQAKSLYDSAFHPQTGEKQLVFGRMSFQVWGNMTITGSMITFYRTIPAIVFWQWVNQTFNALVNYTNRNASSPLSTSQLLSAYGAATCSGVGIGVFLNQFVAKIPSIAGGLVARFVPFVAVAGANSVNLPLMRQLELKHGIDLVDEDGEVRGKSTVAAKRAVSQVVLSRVGMAAPSMVIPPIIMNALHRRKGSIVHRRPWVVAPMTVALTGLTLVFSTPLCCAIFPQKSSISFEHLEPELQSSIRASSKPNVSRLFYNKGL